MNKECPYFDINVIFKSAHRNISRYHIDINIMVLPCGRGNRLPRYTYNNLRVKSIKSKRMKSRQKKVDILTIL